MTNNNQTIEQRTSGNGVLTELISLCNSGKKKAIKHADCTFLHSVVRQTVESARKEAQTKLACK